ncbi:MAG: class II aldolase/adducin family protein [Gammaproteobacteria bacterium]
MAHLALRKRIIATARAINDAGLNPGKSGNVSARVDGGMLITPTGMGYAALRASDIVHMKIDGRVPGRQRKPSSEWRFHRDIYHARADVGAIVHVHSAHATALACTRRGIPAFHYMVAVAGGDSIRCAPYATFGTQRLSDLAVKALRGRQACLLANHGMIACGETVESALALATEVEFLAQQYAISLQIGGTVVLSGAEMRTVLEKFKSYGKQE